MLNHKTSLFFSLVFFIWQPSRARATEIVEQQMSKSLVLAEKIKKKPLLCGWEALGRSVARTAGLRYVLVNELGPCNMAADNASWRAVDRCVLAVQLVTFAMTNGLNTAA